MIFNSKWYYFISIPIVGPVLGWIVGKFMNSINKAEVEELVGNKLAVIKEKHTYLEEKIASIERKLTRLEDKVDRLPELIIETLSRKD